MNIDTVSWRPALLLAVLSAGGCAGSNALVREPSVDLTRVEMSDMSFARQTFLLGFNVYNPNPFPLPVRAVRYNVRLNDQKFAAGESMGNFSIPADGDGSFVISVDLDLLRSGSMLTSVLRSGMRENLDYELSGNLELDMPMAPSIRFSDTGTVMVQSEIF